MYQTFRKLSNDLSLKLMEMKIKKLAKELEVMEHVTPGDVEKIKKLLREIHSAILLRNEIREHAKWN